MLNYCDQLYIYCKKEKSGKILRLHLMGFQTFQATYCKVIKQTIMDSQYKIKRSEQCQPQARKSTVHTDTKASAQPRGAGGRPGASERHGGVLLKLSLSLPAPLCIRPKVPGLGGVAVDWLWVMRGMFLLRGKLSHSGRLPGAGQ